MLQVFLGILLGLDLTSFDSILEGVTAVVSLRMLALLLGNYCFYWLVRVDLGISSISDPLINLEEMSQYQKYC